MPDTTISGLESHLGYWLRYVSNHVSHSFARKLEGCGVTVAEWVMMRELFDVEAEIPSVLAGRLGMTKGAVSKLSDRLLQKGLVSRSEGADLRSHRLALTREGRRLVPELAALADRNDLEFFGHLSAAERAAIEDAMKEIVRRLELRTLPTT